MWYTNNSAQWISLSDMMTWLMLIFLLISILVISEVREYEEELRKTEKELREQKQDLDKARKELAEKELIIKLNEKYRNRVLLEYSNIKDNLHKDLKKAFKEKEKEWQMTISDDMTIKFDNPDIFFQANSDVLTSSFKNILDKFIPKYFSILNNEEYHNKLKEVRIEWHAWKCLSDKYMYCLSLSQKRSNSVLNYIFESNEFKNLAQADKDRLKFIITSNGMSDWKNLDYNWQYTYYSKSSVDANKSRRVEFRIVTNSEDLVDELINKVKY